MKKTWATFNKYDVEILYVSPNNKRLDGAHGITLFDSSEILIANNMSDYMLKRTLIHELMHFALYAYDMSADNAEEEINIPTEEKLCYLMERAIPEIYEQAMSIYNYFK